MPADRLLNTVLGLYQTIHDDAQTDRIFGTTASLLTELSNPLNLSILTSQFLTAPAIWHRLHGLDSLGTTLLRVLGVYSTAAIQVRRKESENVDRKRSGLPVASGELKSDAWARAVVKGADKRSNRWKHLLVLAGVLLGFGHDDEGHNLSSGIKTALEQAVVQAANLALQTLPSEPPVAAAAVVLALNYAFPLISDWAKASLDSDRLLPVAVDALVGDAAFHGGTFLEPIEADISRTGQKLDWPETSMSFTAIRQLSSKPLVETAGPLSKLIAFSLRHVRDHLLVLQAQDCLVAFTTRLLGHWQHNKLSEIDVSEDQLRLTETTLQATWPALWRLLTNVLFALVAVLQPVTARSLLDPTLKLDPTAQIIATKTLHIYRNLYFISSRGNDNFQAYLFSYLTAIDVLASHAEPAAAFLRHILPPNNGSIPGHALHRTLDLFYLNTAEHLPSNLSPQACQTLIIQPAAAYLSHSAPPSSRLVELFEAAHSAVLSALSCPQNGPIVVEMAPHYAETLMTSFPSQISPRQFRLAFKILIQILSPPFLVSQTHPGLAETLLEMVRFRISTIGQMRLPLNAHQSQVVQDAISEQSTLALTLIDALPSLSLTILEEWMTTAAAALHEIRDVELKEGAKQRFWEILGSGEMDAERAAICVAWWGTTGGRELVLFGSAQETDQARQVLMSGAVFDEKRASSRL